MDLSAPYTSLLPRTEGQVLLVLAGTTRPLSGREVARLAEVSQNGGWKTLRRLARHGVVTEQEAGGRTILYTLNREHLAAAAVLMLANLRSLLMERARAEIESWHISPVHASIFGSAARGDGDTESDIDLLLVRPQGVDEDSQQWRAQVNGLAENILAWTGNHAGIVELSEADIRRLRRERPPVVEELEDAAVVLVGPFASDLLAASRR